MLNSAPVAGTIAGRVVVSSAPDAICLEVVAMEIPFCPFTDRDNPNTIEIHNTNVETDAIRNVNRFFIKLNLNVKTDYIHL